MLLAQVKPALSMKCSHKYAMHTNLYILWTFFATLSLRLTNIFHLLLKLVVHILLCLRQVYDKIEPMEFEFNWLPFETEYTILSNSLAK
jgi:hypothetical protein